jgi:hypothetical protein
MTLYLMRFSPSPRRRLITWAYGSILAAFGVVVGGAFALELFGLGRMAALEILVSIGILEFSEMIPLSTWALWVLALALGAAGYGVVRGRFDRVEAPGRSILKPYAEDY